MTKDLSTFRSIDHALTAVHEISEIAQRATLTATTDEELVDVLGALAGQSSALMDIRRGAQVELEDNVTGTMWRITTPRQSERSYNSTGLIAAFAEAFGDNIVKTIGRLVDMGVLKMTWQWRVLQSAAREWEVSLTQRDEPVQDHDPVFLVGRTWKDGSRKFEPVKEID